MKIFWFQRQILSWTLVLIMSTSLSCSNAFKGTQNQSSNDSIWFDAQMAFDKSDFSGSVTKLNLLSAEWKARREVRFLWAQALAAQCGMTFSSVIDTLSSSDNASDKLFRKFMKIFKGRAAEASKCYEAQLKLEEISTDPSLRTASENLFMVFLGMAKIGVYLRAAYDRDSDNGLGDGEADAGALICDASEADGDDTTGSSNKLSSLEMRQVITGFGMIISSFSGAVASLMGDSASQISDLSGSCSAVGLDAVCTASDPTNTTLLTSDVVDTFRDILSAGEGNVAPLALGIGACTNTLDLDPATDTDGDGDPLNDPDTVSPLCCT